MISQIQSFSDSLSNNISPNFIHLKDNVFAEYVFVYHINDGYSIAEVKKINNKQQILFKKLVNKQQQLNLMFIDSSFPILLSDVVKTVLIKNTKSFQQYIDTIANKPIVDILQDSDYLKCKFTSFIHHLLYTNIANDQIFKREIDSDRVYYRKGNTDKIEYYSIYDQNKLQELMLIQMKLEIVYDRTFIEGCEASVCFRIKY